MPRGEIGQNTDLQRAAGQGGPIALKKTSVSLQKTGRTGWCKEGQHCTSPEVEHLNKLTLVEVGF